MPMQVILTQDVDNLGKAGELVSVRPGYGRNYLVPRGMAVSATVKNKNQLDHNKASLRSSQRAVEHMGRQVADLTESKERERRENEALESLVARKERMLEDCLQRARTAESSLATLQDQQIGRAHV